MSYANKTVTTSAAVLVAENKRRTALKIYHNGSTTIYLGTNSSVTTSNGYPFPVGAEFTLRLDVDKRTGEEVLYTGDIYAIGTGSDDIRYWEFDDTADTRET